MTEVHSFNFHEANYKVKKIAGHIMIQVWNLHGDNLFLERDLRYFKVSLRGNDSFIVEKIQWKNTLEQLTKEVQNVSA